MLWNNSTWDANLHVSEISFLSTTVCNFKKGTLQNYISAIFSSEKENVK